MGDQQTEASLGLRLPGIKGKRIFFPPVFLFSHAGTNLSGQQLAVDGNVETL